MEQHEEEGMSKFGVNESVDQDKLEKAASDGCPECSSRLVRHGATLVCPVHGSEPFEGKNGRS